MTIELLLPPAAMPLLDPNRLNRARMCRIAAFTTPGTRTFKIPLDNTSFDDNSMASTGTGRITCVVGGTYLVTGTLGVVGNSDLQLGIYKNAVNVAVGTQSVSAAATYSYASVTDVVQLVAGDFLELWVAYINPVTAIAMVAGSLNNWLAAHLLSVT